MKRLLDGEGSELERDLLDALRVERPSPELEQRMRAAIGLGAVPLPVPDPSSATAATAPTTKLAPATKSASFGAIVGGAVVVAGVVVSAFLVTRGPKEDPTPQASAPVVHAPSKNDAPAVSSAKNETIPAVPAEELAPGPAPVKPRSQPAHLAPASASLREEIRLIDSARVAVKEHDSARALAILTEYARRFPDGSFKEEARVLRAHAGTSR